MENRLNVEYIPVGKLKPYDKNTRKHEDYDVSQIAKSIEQYGFNDPIGIWGKDNIIVEGHGRLLAAKKLGMDKVPCIRLDDLTDEQRREYAIMHNKTAELSTWDFEKLAEELQELSFDGFDVDWGGTNKDEDEESKYTKKVEIPQYEITGECPDISELVDTSKTDELIEKIKAADIGEEQKAFLIEAAHRHSVFNYKNIAEYYAHQPKEIQELMEDSALVIIDIEDAMQKGFCVLTKEIKDIIGDENEDD